MLQGEPVPLKIGIFDDLVALAKSPESEIRKALHWHCRSKLYLAELLVDQAMRHDIDGNPVEPVSEGAKIAAASLMNYRLANLNKKPAEAPAPPANEPTGVGKAKEAPAEPPKGNGAGAAVERLAAARRPNADLPKLTLGRIGSSQSGLRKGAL